MRTVSRPTPLGGFWVLLLGGLALAATLLYAHPGACPNAGAAGNASAFADPAWDYRLPLLVFGWIVLVAIEQLVPTTWRHRDRPTVALRAAAAVSLAIAASCLTTVPLLTACH
jgi:hypothetical protein